MCVYIMLIYYDLSTDERNSRVCYNNIIHVYTI